MDACCIAVAVNMVPLRDYTRIHIARAIVCVCHRVKVDAIMGISAPKHFRHAAAFFRYCGITIVVKGSGIRTARDNTACVCCLIRRFCIKVDRVRIHTSRY
jgi:hypothetical protein